MKDYISAAFCQIKLVEPVTARHDAASTAPYTDQHL